MSRVTERRSQDRGLENKVSIFSPFLHFFLSISFSSSFFFFPPLLWAQIWYSSQRSPSNNLPGVQVTWKSITLIHRFCQANKNGGPWLRANACFYECVRAKGCKGVNHAWGGGERGVRQRGCRERERERERPGQSNERTPEEGWVGALPGGGNLSNWFSLTARTQSCLSTWLTDSVIFSLMH